MGTLAIVRGVSAALADCELSFVERAPIDVQRAAAQHEAYVAALLGLGCEVIEVPALAGFADSVFVEDTALVLDELAIITRPGAASRRGELDSIAEVLGQFRELARIEDEGTLDGGDILRIGKAIYVGEAARSNAEGIAQLRELVRPHGYTVQALPTRDCLHLKSAVTQVDARTVLVQPRWVDPAPFAHMRVIEVDPGEEHAANALLAGGGLVYPDCFPRTRERLERAGIAVTAIDVSELQKAEGAVTCCSLLLSN
jgi:dimethylargininase